MSVRFSGCIYGIGAVFLFVYSGLSYEKQIEDSDDYKHFFLGRYGYIA